MDPLVLRGTNDDAIDVRVPERGFGIGELHQIPHAGPRRSRSLVCNADQAKLRIARQGRHMACKVS